MNLPDSLILCPMMIGDKVVGVISVQSFKKNAYTLYNLDMLKTLASYTAIAIENARLYESLEDKVQERTGEGKAYLVNCEFILFSLDCNYVLLYFLHITSPITGR